MDIFGQMASQIIKEQETIIGPVALEQAEKVPGLHLNQEKREVELQGDKKLILEGLVEKYAGIFGKASIEVCKDAVRNLISQVPKDQVPQMLLQ